MAYITNYTIPFYGTNSVKGTNYLSGFKSWECYMLIKYGKPNVWGVGGKYEYLLELPLYPDEVTESLSAEWSKQSILGRSSPLSAYAQTDLKSVSFGLTLHRDLITGSFSQSDNNLVSAGNQSQSPGGPFETRTWYVNANKMLQMSCYPQYTSNGLIPPTTYFIFGQMILKGYVTSYSTTWKKPILNTFYGWNTVNITMECYPDTIISADDIITNAGAASTQNTYNTKYPGRAEASNVMGRSETTNRSNARTLAQSQYGTLGGQVIDV